MPASTNSPTTRPRLLHELISAAARLDPDQTALINGDSAIGYGELLTACAGVAAGLQAVNLQPGDRVSVYLPKTIENVTGMFGTAMAGGVFVPVNPVLKAAQVAHILRDSGSKILLTSVSRLEALKEILDDCPALERVLVSDADPAVSVGDIPLQSIADWKEAQPVAPGIEADDLTAIFYTSGSTGLPKGVMLTHRNMVTGAQSVSGYLENSPEDRILAVLPFSFDAGFSQLTTGFSAGATIIMMDYLLAGDVARIADAQQVTGITGVPPLWAQLADISWPESARQRLRYFATTGGVMPRSLLDKLRATFPAARPFLMYGLTEAFRSTYLPPAEVDRRPDSIGKAIPDAEILVLRDDGTPCRPGETGELVHCGPLVSPGYWQAPELTARRFRPVPGKQNPDGSPAIGAWSGDSVASDEEGFLYFRGRRDEMIKTSGYRVSPTEIEDSLMASGLVSEIVAVGLPDERLGQSIVIVAAAASADVTDAALMQYCRAQLPAYMLPGQIVWQDALPRNANGKFDRVLLREQVMAARDEE